VPVGAKADAAAILAAYPLDHDVRALIEDMVLGIPTDIADSLIVASDWIHRFPHATSDPTGLSRVRRHLPKREEITWNVRTREPGHLLVDWRALMGVHHWIQPDEDHAVVVVIGWLAMTAWMRMPSYWSLASGRTLAGCSPAFPESTRTPSSAAFNWEPQQAGEGFPPFSR
jgi:hypothetical protein